MKGIRASVTMVAHYRRPYVVLNLLYYGLVICGMIFVAFNPSVQQSLFEAVRTGLTKGPLSVLRDAYAEGRVLDAIVLTFLVNLVLGTFLFITLPSLLIPFSGLLLCSYRALFWGLTLSPTSAPLARAMIPHSLTLVVEGQAYILAMLAVYIQGRAFVSPHTVDAATHMQGYRIGLERSFKLYLLIVLLLAASAVYEALEVIYVVPLLT